MKTLLKEYYEIKFRTAQLLGWERNLWQIGDILELNHALKFHWLQLRINEQIRLERIFYNALFLHYNRHSAWITELCASDFKKKFLLNLIQWMEMYM